MQNLTILTEKIGLCFKAFKQERNKLVKVDLDNPLWFDHKAVEVDSLVTLSKQLKQLESRQDCLVIRGQLIAGRPSQSIRRTLKASAGEAVSYTHLTLPTNREV